MANPEHEAILKQGVEIWNKWREGNSNIKPDLSDAHLGGTNLSYINLYNSNLSHSNFYNAKLSHADFDGSDIHNAKLNNADLSNASLKNTDLRAANLSSANLSLADLTSSDLRNADLSSTNLSGAKLLGAKLSDTDMSKSNLTNTDLRFASLIQAYFTESNLAQANLSGADLRSANLKRADLGDADLSNADLRAANLSSANLSQADLSSSDLRGTNLSRTILIETNFENANLSGCRIYGISAWGLNIKNIKQSNLIITENGESEITVDNLEIAQFVYLLLNNSKLRSVIDTLTTKSVLILGRFTSERKAVLDGIREALRQHGYVPMLFDFEKPANRDLTETVMTLASLARFVIADLSDPNSIPHELMSFADKLFSVPVQGIFCPTEAHPNPYPMYEHLRRLPHVLPIYRYETADGLMTALEEKVIHPAEDKVKAVRPAGLV